MKIIPLTEKLMTRGDLAKFLQVTTRTVDNLRQKGMPTIMVGSSPRFDGAKVRSWLEAEHGSAVADTLAETT